MNRVSDLLQARDRSTRVTPYEFASKLFESQVRSAIADGAESERFGIVVDNTYLYESAMRAKSQLLSQSGRDLAVYFSSRTKYVGSKIDRDALRASIEPMPDAWRSITYAGLLMVGLAGIRADPGIHEVKPNYLLLCLAIGTIVLCVVSMSLRIWGSQRLIASGTTEAALCAIAISLGFTSLAVIHEIPTSAGYTGDASGLVLAFGSAAIGIVSPSFLAWRQRYGLNRAGFRRLLPRANQSISISYRPTAAASGIVVLCALIALIVQSRPTEYLLFPKLSIALLLAGAALASVGTTLSLLTLRFEPRASMKRQLRELDSAFSARWRNTVILPFLRSVADRHRISLEVSIDVADPPGLSQTSDPLFQVSTESAERLKLLIQGMPGGSVGLAGSRGAGKSSLIEQACGDGDPNTLAVVVSAPVSYVARDFILHLYARLCERTLGENRSAGTPLDPIATAVGSRHNIFAVTYSGLSIMLGVLLVGAPQFGVQLTSGQLVGVLLTAVGLSILFVVAARSRFLGEGHTRVGSPALEDIARERLRDIYFQQTISGSSTAAAKVPLGLEATLARGRSFVRQQMSLPEIISSFRNFLTLASRTRRLIIGIDELDKIVSDDKAVEFLNEIKGIFGVRGCYFLVSISEDAMAAFERRGLPFRDAFDSAFDEIVRVKHLSLAESDALLSRRLFGMPIPFKQFCFCRSGGLPRDLIRAARGVVAAQNPGASPTLLSTIVSRVTTDDLRGKFAAMTIIGRSPDCEPLSSMILQWCSRMVDAGSSSASMLKGLEILSMQDFTESADAVAKVDDFPSLRNLLRELASYGYYLATLSEFFNEDAPSERWRTFEPEGYLENLAAIRELVGVSPVLSWTRASEFRIAMGWQTITMPAWLIA